MADKVKDALQQLSYGVYVVTAGLDEGATAFTGSWVMQVSFDPPLVAMAVGRDRFAARILRRGKKFVINVLDVGQGALAGRFAGAAGDDRLAETDILEPQVTSAPALAEALAYLDCEVESTLEMGDHTLFVGRVVRGDVLRQGQPLTTENSGLRYRRLS